MAKIDATPQRLYLLQLSTSTIHRPDSTLEMVSGCYLIQTSDDKNILIDSGLPTDYKPPTGSPKAENVKNVIEHLSNLGLRPDDINILVCTHFDVDHAGNHDAFHRAELIVQRSHYELARSGHPRYASARQHWDNPALHYHLIEGDTEILPGFSVIETSGHAPGHQSILLTLPKTGKVLLAIDAVVLQRLFTLDRRAWPIDDNQEHLLASTQKLLKLVEQEQIALVIFGHDGEQWQTLKKAPMYYE